MEMKIQNVRLVNVRLILDSGIQRSYVTTRMKNQNLKPEGTENLPVKTFGRAEVEQLQTCEYVNLNVETNPAYPDISLTAFVVPEICQPLSHQMTETS